MAESFKTKIWKIIRHNQSLTISSVIALCVLAWVWGCHSQVTSIVNPTVLVTRGELDIEVDTFIAQAKLKYLDLNRQDSAKSYVFNIALDFMRGGQINPVAIAIVLGNILGIGAIIDNRRKDVKIKTLKGESLNDKVKKELKEILVPRET